VAETATERRSKPRQTLRLPVEVLLNGHGIPGTPGFGVLGPNEALTGVTRDISASGVYFYIGKDIGTPQQLDFVLAFPPEFTLSETRKVRCRGEVVRIERDTPSGIGIAAAIRNYEMLEADSTYPFAMVRTPKTL
jgi:hypothetical protein